MPEFTWLSWPFLSAGKTRRRRSHRFNIAGKFRQGIYEGFQPMLPTPYRCIPRAQSRLPSNRRCQSEPGQRGLRNSYKAAHAMPTPIVLANVALSPTTVYYRDTRSLLHVDDPQYSYSYGDNCPWGSLGRWWRVKSEHGDGTHLLRFQRNPEDDISFPSTSGHLLLSCSYLFLSVLS